MTVSYRECGGSPFFFGPRVPPPVGRGGRAKDGICLPSASVVAHRFFLGLGFPLPSVEGVAPKMGFAYPVCRTGPADERWGLPTGQRGPVSFRKSLRRRRNPVNDGICLPNDGIYLSPYLGGEKRIRMPPRTVSASGGRGRDCNRSMVWRTESQNAALPEQRSTS